MKNFLKALAVALLMASTPSFGMGWLFGKKQVNYANLSSKDKKALSASDLRKLSNDDFFKITPIELETEKFEDESQSDFERRQNNNRQFNERLEQERVRRLQVGVIPGQDARDITQPTPRTPDITEKKSRAQLEREARARQIAAEATEGARKVIKEEGKAVERIILVTVDKKELIVDNYSKSPVNKLGFIRIEKKAGVANQKIVVPAGFASLNQVIEALKGNYEALPNTRTESAVLFNAAFDLNAPQSLLKELAKRYAKTISTYSPEEQNNYIMIDIRSKVRGFGQEGNTELAQSLVRNALKSVQSQVAPEEPTQERELSAWERFKNFFRRN